MKTNDLADLYKSIIINHNKKPMHYGSFKDYDHYYEGFNPLCGDSLKIYLKIVSGDVYEAKFESASCSLCKASASMMTRDIFHKTHENIYDLYLEFKNFISDLEIDKINLLNTEIKSFNGLKKYPNRKVCALLPWESLAKALSLNSI